MTGRCCTRIARRRGPGQPPVSIPEKRRSQPQHESNPPPQTLPNRRNIPGQPPVSIPEQRSQPPKVIVRPTPPENAPEASVPRLPDARDNWKQRGTRKPDEPTPSAQMLDQPRAAEPGRGGAVPAFPSPGRGSQQWGRGESGDVQRR